MIITKTKIMTITIIHSFMCYFSTPAYNPLKEEEEKTFVVPCTIRQLKNNN